MNRYKSLQSVHWLEDLDNLSLIYFLHIKPLLSFFEELPFSHCHH